MIAPRYMGTPSPKKSSDSFIERFKRRISDQSPPAKKSRDSSSPEPSIKMAEHLDIEDEKLTIEQTLKSIQKDMSSFRQSMDQKFKNLETSLMTAMNAEISTVKDDMAMHISRLENKIGQLELRMQNMEEAAQGPVPVKEPYEVSSTLIAIGVKYQEEEDLVAKATQLIQEGMGLREAKVVRAMRTPHRNGKPGIVKIEMEDVQAKIQILRAKAKLQDYKVLGNVFIRGSQTHVERLIDLNFKTLLGEIPGGRKYRVTGSGRVVLKDNMDGADNRQDQGDNRRGNLQNGR